MAEITGTVDRPSVEAVKLGFDPDVTTNLLVREFHQYWLRLRGARRFPARGDIDPTAIPHLLSNILLLRVHYDPLDFEYRIIGETVVSRLQTLKGKRVRETALFDAAPGSSAYRNYCAVVERGAPQFLEGLAMTAHRPDRRFLMSRVHCPLSADGAAVDHIISYVAFLDR